MIVVIAANIGRGVKTPEARANLRRIRDSEPRAFVGWQEIDGADEPDEHRLLSETFGPDRYSHAGFGTAVPITVPAPWRIAHQRVHDAMPALPPVGAARRLTEALVQRDTPRICAQCGQPVVDDDGDDDTVERRFVHLNTHMTRTPPPPHPKAGEARQGWDDHLDLIRRRVERCVDRGLPVVFTGDVNREKMPSLHRREVKVWDEWVDDLTVIPAEGWRWVVEDVRSVPLTIDAHNKAPVAALRLRRS